MESEPTPTAGLAGQLSEDILALLRDERAPIGHPITERELAERFRVSRSPIRSALRTLHEAGYVDRTEYGRYRVGRTGEPVPAASDVSAVEDPLYLAIAGDVVDGELAGRFTEAELIRRYEVPRPRALQLLRRMAGEGWAAPLPGYGWEILDVVTSIEAYRAAYRTRLLIEPAGILEPTYHLDADALHARRAEQEALVAGRLWTISAAEHFELNNRFHETIVACSRNEFLLDTLVRVNKRRRLFEYRRELQPEPATAKCAEHVAIADLLLAGDRASASEAMRRHIASASADKAEETP